MSEYPKYQLPSGGWTTDKEYADKLWAREPYWRGATEEELRMGCAVHVPSTACFGRWNNCRPYPQERSSE